MWVGGCGLKTGGKRAKIFLSKTNTKNKNKNTYVGSKRRTSVGPYFFGYALGWKGEVRVSGCGRKRAKKILAKQTIKNNKKNLPIVQPTRLVHRLIIYVKNVSK